MLTLFEQDATALDKAVVMVGRFQPPTKGHYHVVDKMKEYMRTNKDGVDACIIVIVDGAETSKDKSKNPLTSSERESFIRASGKADGVQILHADSAFNAFVACKRAGFEPVTVAAGSDRSDHYLELLDKHFNKDHTGKKITHQGLPGLTRDMSGDGTGSDISKISGSNARHAAEHGYLEEFTEIVGLAHKPNLAKKLFNKVASRVKE